MEIIICANGTLLKNFNRKFGVVDFRREHNIVNFRNAKWKIHILSNLFDRSSNPCLHSLCLTFLLIHNAMPVWDSFVKPSGKDTGLPVFQQ